MGRERERERRGVNKHDWHLRWGESMCALSMLSQCLQAEVKSYPVPIAPFMTSSLQLRCFTVYSSDWNITVGHVYSQESKRSNVDIERLHIPFTQHRLQPWTWLKHITLNVKYVSFLRPLRSIREEFCTFSRSYPNASSSSQKTDAKPEKKQ